MWLVGRVRFPVRVHADELLFDGQSIQTVATGAPACMISTAVDWRPEARESAAAISSEQADTLPVTRVAIEPGVVSALTEADRIIAVGRGLGSAGALSEVEQLAAALGAEIGCSMPVADELGWLPRERYVGFSGQRVSPRLYLALGISGAPQHLAGIRKAKTVVAVNTDPAALFFKTADYGIVGDLHEVGPALIEALK